jgi:protein tyrosine phosphatase (PTP) superfamily phosphohydrolase (DUF442 family)
LLRKTKNVKRKTKGRSAENQSSPLCAVPARDRATGLSSRFTLHLSRLPFYASRFTFHVSRFTFLVLRFTFLVGCFRFISPVARVVHEMTLDLANREGPDLTWIADDLAIGSQVLTDEWPAVAATGIRAVVDCRLEACDPVDLLRSLDIAFLHLPTLDAGDFTPSMVNDGVAWIEQQLASGRRTLVHCRAGKGRSVLIGAAVLTRRGYGPDDALALIRERRPIVTPTPGQIARLRAFADGFGIRDQGSIFPDP